MKKIIILGSTGSIGTQGLDVIRAHRDKFSVSALTCGNNVELLSKQIEEFSPKLAVCKNEKDALLLKKKHKNTQILWGDEGINEAASGEGDLVLNSLMGMMGLVPTYKAIEKGKNIALANKETLVVGGELFMSHVAKHNVKLLPVDSEHSAIFQSLEGNKGKAIKRILLTASGGPFRGYTKEQLSKVTLEEALKHPKWTMGRKITIDSATMMNKGLEVIEARWLFDVPLDKIQVLVHPQSILHSAVEFADTSVIGQMGIPDMRIPISVAFGYPDRLAYENEGLDFFKEASNLTFEKPDTKVFRCLSLAYEASRLGGSYPIAMNGANEVLVDMFLHGRISFLDIEKNIEKILNEHKATYNLGLNDIIEIDKEVRIKVREKIERDI